MALRLIASLAATAVLAATGACAKSESPRTKSESPSVDHGSKCTRARIGGHIVCLAPGKQCKRRYEHLYVLYGFTCKRDPDGRYRLHERIFIGTPAPQGGR